jgi:periplasmic protein TonB
MNRTSLSFVTSLLFHSVFVWILFLLCVAKPFHSRAIPVDFVLVKQQGTQIFRTTPERATKEEKSVVPKAHQAAPQRIEGRSLPPRVREERIAQTPAEAAPSLNGSVSPVTQTAAFEESSHGSLGRRDDALDRVDPATGNTRMVVATSMSTDGAATNKKASLREIVGAQLRQLVEENKDKAYPEKAKRMGWEGKSDVSLWICEDGTVENVRIAKSSGYQVLDEAAKGLLSRLKLPFRPGERFDFIQPVNFSLDQQIH